MSVPLPNLRALVDDLCDDIPRSHHYVEMIHSDRFVSCVHPGELIFSDDATLESVETMAFCMNEYSKTPHKYCITNIAVPHGKFNDSKLQGALSHLRYPVRIDLLPLRADLNNA